MIFVFTIGSLCWSSVSVSYQQRDGVQQCTSKGSPHPQKWRFVDKSDVASFWWVVKSVLAWHFLNRDLLHYSHIVLSLSDVKPVFSQLCIFKSLMCCYSHITRYSDVLFFLTQSSSLELRRDLIIHYLIALSKAICSLESATSKREKTLNLENITQQQPEMVLNGL